jgi:hypothetical protein
MIPRTRSQLIAYLLDFIAKPTLAPGSCSRAIRAVDRKPISRNHCRESRIWVHLIQADKHVTSYSAKQPLDKFLVLIIMCCPFTRFIIRPISWAPFPFS